MNISLCSPHLSLTYRYYASSTLPQPYSNPSPSLTLPLSVRPSSSLPFTYFITINIIIPVTIYILILITIPIPSSLLILSLPLMMSVLKWYVATSLNRLTAGTQLVDKRALKRATSSSLYPFFSHYHLNILFSFYSLTSQLLSTYPIMYPTPIHQSLLVPYTPLKHPNPSLPPPTTS